MLSGGTNPGSHGKWFEPRPSLHSLFGKQFIVDSKNGRRCPMMKSYRGQWKSWNLPSHNAEQIRLEARSHSPSLPDFPCHFQC